jgi:hypothetical protein
VTKEKPNIILSSFACSGASATDEILKPLLNSIGYYVTPFGIEGSHRICSKISSVDNPLYHFTHAPPSMFKLILEEPDYRFIYNYRDPRDSVISWAYNEISEGNVKGDIDIDLVRLQIIVGRFHLEEHIRRAREWLSMGDRVCKVFFEKMKGDRVALINKIIDFIGITGLLRPGLVNESINRNSDEKYIQSLKIKEAYLSKLNLVRTERGITGAWITGFTPVEKLLVKKSLAIS